MAEQDSPRPTITAMQIPIIKKGEYDIWSMRMRQYICHTDHNLWDIIVDGDLQEETAPAGEQSSPPAPKTAKQLTAKRSQERVKSILLLAILDEYLLKFHNFENFTTEPNESLDKAYDRFQKLISQLEVHAAPVSREDINQKFLRSLPPSWSQIALIMRNKPDIDQTDIDDLYNNLRVYEDEMKRSSSSTSNSQNLAFLSSENTSRTNETTSPPIDNEDLQQIDQDDLEELDIRWQVAMLTVRVQRFIKKTGRNLDFKGKQPVTFDKSQVECYNYHRKGHFAKECKSRWNQGKRSYGDNGRRNATTNEPSSQALVAQDGLGGYDWSNDFDEPVNYALMAISSSRSSSSSDNEVQNYSKQCLESFKTLQKNYDSEREKHSRVRLEIQGYELALESLESRILGHEKNELAWGEKYDEISMSVFEVRSSDEEITPANDRFSKADGYHAVPPPITGNFLTPRADISFAGKTNKVNIEKPKSAHESIMPKPNINKDKVVIEDWYSDDEDDVSEVNTVSPVKTNETQTVKTRVDKIDQKQGIGFKKIKACFVCKSADHLIKDCNFYDKQSQEPKLKTMVNTGLKVDKPVWDNTKRVNHQIFSKYPHLKKTFVPSGVLTRTCLITHVKQNEKRAVHKVSTARPVSTARHVSFVRSFAPKIAQTSGAIRPIYPRMDNGNLESILQDHAVVDSGCSSHMTGNKVYLSDYKDYNRGLVAFGSDPKGGKITGKGKIRTANLDFDDVYFVDELKFNLFSVSQMCDKKNSVLFTNTECLILSPSFKLLDESQVVLRAPRQNGVYSLDLKNIVPSGGITCLYANATTDESKLWHRRLGHVNFKNINKLVKGHLVRGLPSKVFVNDHTCVTCKKGGQHKASCKAKLKRTIRKPLELLHMDLFGLVSVESINKKNYCLVVTDDFSRFSWIFFLTTKDETNEILYKFITGLENQLNHKVKTIRCDHGTKFKNHAMNEFCANKGIKREFSVARTLQQNGVAE
ncbi:putative ribonuclease H-like domain-containing protein, partial [Tanacetum coccineum]